MYSILLVHSGPDDSTEGGHLLTCGVIDPSRLFWCEMHSLEMSAVEMNYMVLKATKNI